MIEEDRLVKTKKEKDSVKEEERQNISYAELVGKSKKFAKLKKELTVATKLSLTGITNLVVNYEDPHLVNYFLKTCWKASELYHETYDIDAVELQMGAPGQGNATAYLDSLIYGSPLTEEDTDGLGAPSFTTDPQTGARQRKPDGFVNRKEVVVGEAKNKTLIIKNIDYCMDFFQKKPGEIDARSLAIFDNFRNPDVKSTCKIVLVTNEKLKLPFAVRTVELEPVDEFEADHILCSFIRLYQRYNVHISFSEAQKKQIIRKLCGLTYTESGDAIAEAMSRSMSPDSKDSAEKKIISAMVVRELREKINRSFMEKASGLTHLSPKPWEDYICPESSNFTDDVEKILRDFREIEELKEQSEVLSVENKDNTMLEYNIEAIQTRIPHVIVLYGKGGVGKCLGKGTKVRMLDGSMKKVEDIKVNDLLMGPDSKHRTVLSTTHGSSQLYKVKQKNGKNYVCNGSHILSLKKEGKHQDEPLFISVEDYLKQNKTWKKTHYGWKAGVEYNDRDLPIDPYWMGLWLGDGTSQKPSITVGSKDRETKEWLINWAKKEKLFLREEKKSKTDAITLNFSSRVGSGWGYNYVKESLKDMDLLGNKHIPHLYKINSRKKRLQLLAGLIDSDGHQCVSGSLQFFNINERLANDVAELGRSLGFKVFQSSSIKRLKANNYSVRCYIVTFGGNLSEIPTKIKRKQSHDNPQKIGVKCGIKVEPFEYGDYYGFTLDGDKQFLLEDYTVSHNSAFPIHFADLLKFDVWDFNVGASHSKWIGEGAERMREALSKIDKASHVVVRIDEYDRAMGATDSSGQGMHEAHKQVEAEFMNWLQNSQEDNLFVKNNIFIVMTTNHKDNITGPLLRSGRADLVIDIDNFDEKSMVQTFKSAPRRNNNRGIKMLGLGTQDKLEEAINKLDIEKLAELATAKHFTVRDIDVLLLEMAAHDYYFRKGQKGIQWTTDNFIKVLECSSGSIKGDSTCELKLGDREVINGKASDYDPQTRFSFDEECIGDNFNIDAFKNSDIFS